jgi:uncharacterized protein (TIGR03083 family)
MKESIFSFDKREVVDGVRAQRAHTLALLEDLNDTQWETEVLPGWRTREVAAHLVSTDEASLTGKFLLWGLKQKPMPEIEHWNEGQVPKWADRPIPELLQGLEKWGRRFARVASMPPKRLASLTFPSGFGRVSLLWLAMLRIYDEWVHVEDLRRALSLPDDGGVDTLPAAAKFMLAGIPIQTLREIPPGAAGTLAIGFVDVDTPPLCIDLGTRRFGIGLPADAHIKGPAASLIMVAAGRDPWREVEAAGHLRISGDRKAEETFLDVLRVV